MTTPSSKSADGSSAPGETSAKEVITPPNPTKKSRLRRAALAFGVALLLLLVFVRLRYGGGEHYDDVTTRPLVADEDVERIGVLPFPAGNVTATHEGRVFVNIHPFVQAFRFTDSFVFELVDGEPRPFPNAETQMNFRFVFGMNVGPRNRLWLTSPATLDRSQTRLMSIDLDTKEVVFDHLLEEGIARFGQDLRITPDGDWALFADTGAFRFTDASLVALNLHTMETRTLLEGHHSVQPQDWMIRTAEGEHTIGGGLITFSVGVDGIAISPSGEDVYFASMSHDTLYRVPLRALLDENMSRDERAAQVEAVATKPLSDGIETSDTGEVLITDVEHGAIVGIEPGGRRRTLVRLREVSWTDGIAVAGGRVYFTDSQIPRYLDPLLRPPPRSAFDAWAPHVAVYAFDLPD